MQQTDQPTGYKTLMASVSAYIKLLLEDTKLNCAEKLTRFLSSATLFLLLTIIITVVMVFVSIAVSLALATVMNPMWAFIIVAGFYLALMAVLFFGRTTLIVNPIAKFISTILLDPPTDTKPEENA